MIHLQETHMSAQSPPMQKWVMGINLRDCRPPPEEAMDTVAFMLKLQYSYTSFQGR